MGWQIDAGSNCDGVHVYILSSGCLYWLRNACRLFALSGSFGRLPHFFHASDSCCYLQRSILQADRTLQNVTTHTQCFFFKINFLCHVFILYFIYFNILSIFYLFIIFKLYIIIIYTHRPLYLIHLFKSPLMQISNSHLSISHMYSNCNSILGY